MQQPRPVAGFADELDRAIGHVRRFRMLLLHARRQVRVPQQPAAQDFAVRSFRRVGEVVPRVFARIPFRVEPVVVAKLAAPPLERRGGMDAVIVFERLEPGLRHDDADVRRGIEPQPRQALAIGDQVRLPDDGGTDAERPQVVADGKLADGKRDAVPGRAMTEHRAARVEARARRSAYGGLHVGAVEADSHLGDRVDVGSLERRMTVAGQIVPAQLVAHDEQDVRYRAGHSNASPFSPMGPANASPPCRTDQAAFRLD